MQKFQHLFDTAHLQTDLKKRSLRSGAVTLSSQAVKFILQLGSTMVLARILTPDDYGIMAMVVAITGFAGIFINLGLSTAVIQRAEINHEQVSTLFWINAGIGALVMFIVATLSPVIAWFYQTPALKWVTVALSLNFLINGLAVQHQALLNRQMRFVAISIIQVGAMIVGIAIAIMAGIYGFGYWALVLNSLTISIFTVIGGWVGSGWRPGLPRRNAGVGEMIRFGSDIVGFNIINYFSRNLDNILIGKYHGSGTLGLYSKAYQLLMMPITNLRDPMLQVAIPALSRLQNETEKFCNYYTTYVSILAFVSMPLVMFMFACSDQLIRLLLGPQWIGASVIFKILSLAAFIQPVGTTWGLILLSRGQSKRYFKWGVINSAFIVLSFLIGLPWGAKGVAASYTFANYIFLIPSLTYAFKKTHLKIIHFIEAILKPLIGSLALCLSCLVILKYLYALSDIIVLIICFGIGFIIYFLVIIVMSNGLKDIREYYSYVRIVFSKNK